MATPLTAAAFLAALRTEGVSTREVGSWRTHNRNAVGKWGPVNGVMIHHTVTSGVDASVRICRDGYTGLPGPLCHGVIAKDGTVHLVGYGRTNHAGTGSAAVLTAVIAERTTLPPPGSGTDGNARFYGFECINLGDGKDPWPAAQLEAVARAAAGICRAHGWNQYSVIGHAEWQAGKIDPRGPGKAAAVMMRELRARIGVLLTSAPSPPKKEVPAPVAPPKEALMVLSKDDIENIATRVWRKDGVLASPSTAAPGNTHWTADSYIRDIHVRIRRIEADQKALLDAVGALAEVFAERDSLDPGVVAREVQRELEGLSFRLSKADDPD